LTGRKIEQITKFFDYNKNNFIINTKKDIYSFDWLQRFKNYI